MAEKNTELIKAIGRRIQARRKQLGLTQEQLAELANLSLPYIASVESGAKGLGEESIIHIASSLRVSTDHILTGADNDTDRQYLVQLTRPLSGQQLRCLEEIIKNYLLACGHGPGQG